MKTDDIYFFGAKKEQLNGDNQPFQLKTDVDEINININK